MYREGERYDELKKVIIQIFIDYDIKFPVDCREVCRKLGIALVPYSAFDEEGQRLLLKKSVKGFFVRASKGRVPTIYYNDSRPEGDKRFTIFHEIKHFVCEDVDDKEDDLADFFSRFFMCPIPYLLLKDVKTPEEVVSLCNVDIIPAGFVIKNINNRRKKYCNQLFDYEIPLIEHLDPVLMEVSKYND